MPAASVGVLDPDIVGALNEVSAARIETRIRALAAFGTRHTLSDANSASHGIGAARRYIQRELQACSDAAGGRLKVTLDAYTEPAGPRLPRAVQIVNVVATLPGKDTAAAVRHLVVSGHYDSRASDVMDATTAAPGANDDASGVAAVMEMACVMSRHRFESTLVFMAVAGEEQGLLGATHWAAQARANGLRIDAMITNDIIGSPLGDDGIRRADTVRLFADGATPLLRRALVPPRSTGALEPNVPGTDGLRAELDGLVRAGGLADGPTLQLGRHLKAVAERYLPGFNVELIPRPDRYLRGGDHLPFLERGYAAVRFTEPVENFSHQHQNVRSEGGVAYGDVPEAVDFGYVADVTRVNLAGLATLARAPAAPSQLQMEVSALGNDTTLRWQRGNEPDLAGYRVLWRAAGMPLWQRAHDVGLVTRVTLPGLSKDNLIFGVQALDRDGHASAAAFPMPVRE